VSVDEIEMDKLSHYRSVYELKSNIKRYMLELRLNYDIQLLNGYTLINN